MKTKFILFLLIMLSGIEGIAQFPFVVQNTSGSNLTVYSSAGSGSITSLASNKRLVAFSQSGNYYQVYLPTDGINGGSMYFPTGYILKSGMTIDYNTGYVQLIGTGVSFRRDYNTPGTAITDRVWIYPTSTGDYEFAVTDVNGTGAKFAVTSQQFYSGYTRYNVDLTQNCNACVSGSCTVGSNFSSQNFGWLSGQYCSYVAPNPCTATTVSSHPSNTSVSTGSSATFTVSANGTTPITYQWEVNTGGGWSSLTNGGNTTWTTTGTTSTLSVSNTTTGMTGYTYRCVISNSCSSNVNSNSATLTISTGCTATAVSSHPSNTSVSTGSTATFSVSASGTTPITYQWQVNTGGGWNNLTNGGNTSWTTSGTTSTLSISNTTVGMSGNTYRCVLSNTCSSNVNSNSATLTVNTLQNGVISGTVIAPEISDLSGMVVNNTVSATVKIFNAGSTTPLNTTTSTGGNFSFNSLAIGNYDIEASISSGGVTYKTLKSNVQSGTSGVSIKLSYKVIEQISTLNSNLQNLTCYLNDLGANLYLTTSYNMNSSNSFIATKRALTNNFETDIEALLRLAMAERMLVKYYEQATTMTQEFVMSADEFAHTVFNLVKIATCITSNFVDDLAEMAVDQVTDVVKLPIELSSSPNKIYFIGAIEGAADGIKTKGKNLDIDYSTIYNSQKGWIQPLYVGGSLQASYVNNTISLPTSFVSKSQTYNFTGNLTNTVSTNNQMLTSSIVNTAYAQGWADGLRNNPGWITFLGNLATNTACSNPISKIASIGYNGARIVLLSSSIFKSVKRTFQLVNEVDPTASNSYYKTDGVELNNFNNSLHSSRSINAANSVANFESEYLTTISELSAGNYSSLSNHVAKLTLLNKELNRVVKEEVRGLKSALTSAQINDSLVLHSLQNTLIHSPMSRVSHLIALSYFAQNQNELAIRDSILANANSIFAFNAYMLDELDSLAITLSNSQSPAYIAIENSTIPLISARSTLNSVSLTVKNYGSTNANNVYVKLDINGLAEFSTDSIFIGSLLVDEEKTIAFNLLSPSIDDTLSFYLISIFGDSVFSEPKGGTTSSSKRITSISMAKDAHSPFSLYPNPNNGTFRITTETLSKKTSQIKLYSTMGQLVYTKEVISTENKFDEVVSTSNLPKGIYTLILLIDEKQYTKKVIIE